MNKNTAEELLKACGQEHVLKDFAKLTKAGQKALLAQIAEIDAAKIARCQAALAAGGDKFDSSKGVAVNTVSFDNAASKAKLERAAKAGYQALVKGRVAALVVAGGQGSRLGFEGPKGAYPIGPVSNAPIFFYHARKALNVAYRGMPPPPLYVMTSQANYDATVKCFRDYGYFGLKKEDVFFFKQGMWPAMDDNGKVLMDRPGHIFMSPDGHGGLLDALVKSGALADMKRRKITTISFFQVDNPLVNIFDPVFIGHHLLERSEYSLKLCEKREPFEKLGMPMRFGKTYRMVEYTEMSKAQCLRKDKHGKLYFRYGSPAIHLFSYDFLERAAKAALPIHLAHKAIPIAKGGKLVKPAAPNGWKFEKFIFDIMPLAKRVAFMEFDRNEEFSPVKNAEGDDSPATCRQAISAKVRQIMEFIHLSAGADAVLDYDPAVYADLI